MYTPAIRSVHFDTIGKAYKTWPVRNMGGRICELSYSATQQVVNIGPLVDVGDNTNALVCCDLIAPQFIGTAVVRYLSTFNIMPTDYGGIYSRTCIMYPWKRERFETYVLKY